MKFLKIWNWIKKPRLPDVLCSRFVPPPCEICWMCVGLFCTILAIISLLANNFTFAMALAIIAVVSYTCGLIQNENEK